MDVYIRFVDIVRFVDTLSDSENTTIEETQGKQTFFPVIFFVIFAFFHPKFNFNLKNFRIFHESPEIFRLLTVFAIFLF